jgi:hypothetical protein
MLLSGSRSTTCVRRAVLDSEAAFMRCDPRELALIEPAHAALIQRRLADCWTTAFPQLRFGSANYWSQQTQQCRAGRGDAGGAADAVAARWLAADNPTACT